MPGDLRFSGNVLELHTPLIKIQGIIDHIAGEIEIRQTVVVEVPYSDSPAVVDVFFVENVKRIAFYNTIRKDNVRFFGGNELKESIRGTLTACQ